MNAKKAKKLRKVVKQFGHLTDNYKTDGKGTVIAQEFSKRNLYKELKKSFSK